MNRKILHMPVIASIFVLSIMLPVIPEVGVAENDVSCSTPLTVVPKLDWRIEVDEWVDVKNAATQNIVINEILYDTVIETNRPQHEWFELYNPSSSPVNLYGYVIEDNVHRMMINTSVTIDAFGYLVICNNVTAFREDYPDYEGKLVEEVNTASTETDDPRDDGNAVPLEYTTYTWEDIYLNNGGDWVKLFFQDPDPDDLNGSDYLVDAVAWENTPGSYDFNPPDASEVGMWNSEDVEDDYSIQRSPNGQDTNDCDQDFCAYPDGNLIDKTSPGEHNTVITVPDEYPTIQEAVNAANPSDTIFVRAGRYYEWVEIDKGLSLIGENKSITIIDGVGIVGAVVRVTANNVSISGFTITNSSKAVEPSPGIYLDAVSGCYICGNIIESNSFGIHGSWSSNNFLSRNIIRNNNRGIELSTDSSYNTLSENVITNNKDFGVSLLDNSKNVLSDNIITNCDFGIYIGDSFNHNLFSNQMSDNKFNLVISAPFDFRLESFIHNVDISNLVNGKPIYYFINQENLVINSSLLEYIGYLALINSTNVTVEGLTLTDNGQGILLAYTTNSLITGNTLANNNLGIDLYNSSDNTLANNSIEDNGFGIHMVDSSENILFGNNIANNFGGIRTLGSSKNRVSGNNIVHNKYGVYFDYARYSTDNLFYHNNFVNNTSHVFFQYERTMRNFWNDIYPKGGNYWSNYRGNDEKSGPNQDEPGSDGIGDTVYVISPGTLDRYPLMNTWSQLPIKVFDVIWEDVHYSVPTISNSTITHFLFNHTLAQIRLNVTGAPDTKGYCNITIPKALLYGNFTVLIDTSQVDYEQTENSTHTSLYFIYTHTTHYVQITATPPHDIAILSVVPSVNEVYEGQIVNITLALKNNGSVSETFNVTAYASHQILDFIFTIQTKNVTDLPPRNQTILTLSWNTTNVTLGNYTISAEASVVPGETYATDNIKVNGTVNVIPEFTSILLLFLVFLTTTTATTLMKRKTTSKHPHSKHQTTRSSTT